MDAWHAHHDTVGSVTDETLEALAEGVPRLEALRIRDLLSESSVSAILDPDSGLDLGLPTTVLVARGQAEFARRLLRDAEAGVEMVPDDSPAALVARISEHLDAVRALVAELEESLRGSEPDG